jgi:pro-kumamolisin-like protein
MKTGPVVSAQVVLVAANGARPGPGTRITSQNIHEWAPSAETIERVSDHFRAMGFEVGECVGNSMAITGPVRLFESGFRVRLRKAGGGMQFAGERYEMASEKIPSTLRAHVAAITFTPPPDFGPGAATSFG